MLFDPKWEVQTKPDIYALPTLIAWLEKQPAGITYCYTNNGLCLLSQYFTAMGFSNIFMFCDGFLHGPRQIFKPRKHDARQGDRFVSIPECFDEISIGHPRTFGAALARAKALQS